MVPVAEEGVLLDESTGSLHALDSLATLIWRCFDGVASLGEIAVDVAEVFSVDESAALNDLLQLTSDLSGRGLLDGTDPVSTAPAPTDDSVASGFLRNPPDP